MFRDIARKLRNFHLTSQTSLERAEQDLAQTDFETVNRARNRTTTVIIAEMDKLLAADDLAGLKTLIESH